MQLFPIRYSLTAVILSLSCSAPHAHAGLLFVLNDQGGANVGSAARNGFEEAANFWSSKFSDDITINLNIGYSNLGPGILGSTDAALFISPYSLFRNATQADRTSAADQLFAGNLPSSSFDVYMNRTTDNPNGSGSATPYVDNDGGANNTSILVSSANAKALGLISANNPIIDATILFSSGFGFDLDRSDGIAGGMYDFVGIAIHEIGHALGFISGVDIFESQPLDNDNAATFVTPLDFTRFSVDSELAGADLDWTADTRSKYFSIDGGTTTIVSNAWSTGRINGDGRQASHWKDGRGLGVMDPTAAPGELLVVTDLDLLAFDVIGFDLVTAVPEPSSFAYLGMVVIPFVQRRLVLRFSRQICFSKKLTNNNNLVSKDTL